MVRHLTDLDLRIARGAAGGGGPWSLPKEGARTLGEVWSGEPDPDDPVFQRFLADLSDAARGGAVQLAFPPWRAPEVTAPGVWNLLGDRRFAAQYPLSWNTLDPASPNYALKRFQRRLYLQRLEPWLDGLPHNAHVLDLGGGIGRFAVAWLARGFRVQLADPNADALSLALGHLARVGGPFSLRHLAAERLDGVADDTFHAVSAMEVFCYLSDPLGGLREAARVLRSGGVLMASVESPVGSLDPTIPHSREEITAALGETERAVEGDTWVRYFTRDALAAAVEAAGLEVVHLEGTHYLPDGPMHHLLDVERLGDPAYERGLLELEALLAGSARWADCARAWLVVARKP